MPLQIETHPQATSDIENAFAWYLERSEVAAAGFMRELERGIALVLAGPTIWPIYEGVTRAYPLRRFPYKLIYYVTETHLNIVAVAHQRRKPGYWV